MGGVQFDFHHPALDLGTLLGLWTLCLAPLIAHVFAGVPSPIHLCAQRPSWIDRVVLWNPTSIIWRYFTIFDRRVRAKNWNREILASSNALFWTSKGWVGSEDMIQESRAYCTRLPSSSHAELLSKSFVNTVIVTLQGVQALYQLLLMQKFNNSINVATVFLPLALLGLVRLPAALWITDDFAYADYDAPSNNRSASQGNFAKDTRYHQLAAVPSPTDETLQWQPLTSTDACIEAFHPRSGIRGCLTRLIFLTPILAIAGLAALWTFWAAKNSAYLSGTGFLSILFWLAFTFGSALIFITNMARAQDRTTVVPGASSVWYRLYTTILFLLALALFITATLETKETACGKFTVLYEQDVCPDLTHLPEHSLMYFNATAMNGSVSGTGWFNATRAYIAGTYRIGFLNASLDATPKTASKFLNESSPLLFFAGGNG